MLIPSPKVIGGLKAAWAIHNRFILTWANGQRGPIDADDESPHDSLRLAMVSARLSLPEKVDFYFI